MDSTSGLKTYVTFAGKSFSHITYGSGWTDLGSTAQLRCTETTLDCKATLCRDDSRLR